MAHIIALVNIQSIIATHLPDRSRRRCAAQDQNLIYIRKTLQVMAEIALSIEAYNQFRQFPLLRFRK